MSETSRNFISSIKVKGINLLPPLITENIRLELQRYKHQSIKLEKRLQNCRELTKNLNALLNFESLSNRPQSVTLKGDIHVETLHIGEVSSGSNNNSKRRLNLTRDIIDVTEYNNDGIRIINSESDMNNDLNQGHQLNQNCSSKAYETDTSLNETSEIRLSHPTINKEDINNCPDNQPCQVLDLSRSIESGVVQEEKLKNCSDTINTLRNISPLNYENPIPRLIRSNSYTLETPSPILLAHLEKCHKKGEQENTRQSKKPNFTKKWSSLESNYIPFENSEFSSINTVYKNDQIFPGEKIESPITENKIENSKSPTIEVIQTDISVQQITVNTNKEENESLKTTLDLADPDSQLMQVLKNIPEDYSKQIIELIEKQRLEHKKRTECFRTVERPDDTPTKHANLPNINTSRNQMDGQNKLHADKSLSISGHENNVQGGTPHSATNSAEIQENDFFSDSTICPSPSQSVHYNMSCSDTPIPSSPFMELNELGDDVNIDISDELYTAGKSDGLIHLYSRKKSFSKELFPQTEVSNMNTIKQEWAASIIGAHVKGYLTRRLLKTERVESLIDTIKDALLCALQLHNSDNIDESDVELHRRLINQVSAACYAFHDIFFTLSIPEQMTMISKDRQRKIEKALRPTSAPTPRRSRSTSSRSSAKRLTPHSQSLTKV